MFIIHLLKFREDLEGIFLEVCHEMKRSNDGPGPGAGVSPRLSALIASPTGMTLTLNSERGTAGPEGEALAP